MNITIVLTQEHASEIIRGSERLSKLVNRSAAGITLTEGDRDQLAYYQSAMVGAGELLADFARTELRREEFDATHSQHGTPRAMDLHGAVNDAIAQMRATA